MEVHAAHSGIAVRARLTAVAVAACAWVTHMLVKSVRVARGIWQTITPPPMDLAQTRYRHSPPSGVLTEQEAERMMTLRQRFGGHPEYLEFELSENRLAFACWLVQRGQLGEANASAGDIVPVTARGADPRCSHVSSTRSETLSEKEQCARRHLLEQSGGALDDGVLSKRGG
jgi:hypothetical protein